MYPVPEQYLGGLGMHLTLDMAGQARFGPDTEWVAGVDYRVGNFTRTEAGCGRVGREGGACAACMTVVHLLLA